MRPNPRCARQDYDLNRKPRSFGPGKIWQSICIESCRACFRHTSAKGQSCVKRFLSNSGA
uniref:Uncharacterized protein n=1 Tax=uncultured alpha proteobacterium HF0130_06E21 TaxID=710808 RepID=E0XT05_9PROT|nr:hypothetical protein [uncultured alpha proteobacterium HF0130_06E21]